ncbi:hypothetical protein NTD84_08175 [Pseudomonas sp. 14P_8.1_Bac3]|uniref:hypothetical protein n=1 Tax=Pseudomonas sp. 14P_8.1_Bac3 TaxID=2971621 RepID=UPI0021C9ECB0|nr:hypothetical protein [Pseudomonas sp. 14P_8.1_Bac3]MCU1759697.1 hypothetical protein [Pseudomonas sp. 14P_8.1_Bac3]
MNTKIAALTLAGLVSYSSVCALAADPATDMAAPPAALPGLNQGQGSESKQEKASKKGEESSGANAGSDSKTLQKDSGASHKADEYQKKQRETHPGGVKKPAS